MATNNKVKITIDDDGDSNEEKPAKKPVLKSARKPKTAKAVSTAKKPAVKRVRKPIAAESAVGSTVPDEQIRKPLITKQQITVTDDDAVAMSPAKIMDGMAKARQAVVREITAAAPRPAPIAAPVRPIESLPDPVKEMIAADRKAAEPVESAPPPARRSLRLYRRIAFSFITAAIALLLAVGYFYFVKATITIIPNQEKLTSSMLFDVYDNERSSSTAANAIAGVVREITLSRSKAYPAGGSEVIGQEAVGKAKIINNYDRNQPLVATTRLLTPDGKLFRIKETVTVPAGGSVEVEIYADQPSAEMAIGPSRFTIPGLWAGIQDKVYAESTQAVEYRQKLKRQVSQEDIDNAVRDLKQALLASANDAVTTEYEAFPLVIYKIDEQSIESKVDQAVGDEVEEFTVAIDAAVVVVAFNDEQAAALARQQFIAALPSDKVLLEFKDEDIVYAMNAYDVDTGSATVNANFQGKVSMKDNAEIVDRNQIVGLKKAELDAFLKADPDIAGYEVVFTPSFIQRLPKLVDRIEVKVKK